MSREIKFRCWSEKEKAYLDGPGRFLWVSHDDATSGLYSPTNLQITLEQYTGLKDQYGKEIYEGDIIKVAEMVKGYVTQDVEGRWIILGDDRKPIDGYITLGELEKIPEINLRTILATEYCSIIGNIHENPELLEAEK